MEGSREGGREYYLTDRWHSYDFKKDWVELIFLKIKAKGRSLYKDPGTVDPCLELKSSLPRFGYNMGIMNKEASKRNAS